MVSAYGTIANDGERRVPRLVTRIEASDGRVLETFGPQGGRALSRREAHTLIDMMRGVVDRGTGRGIRAWGVTGDLAGKTGTTQGNADAWFILMHPELVAGAWVGFNDQRVTFRSNYWGQGAHNALLVVGDFARRAQAAGYLDPDARFSDPPQYRQPLDYDFGHADTLLFADFDVYFENDAAGEEFDREVYEEVWGELGRLYDDRDEAAWREEALERLRTVPFADRPEKPLPEGEDLNARDEDFMTAEEMLGLDEEELRPPGRSVRTPDREPPRARTPEPPLPPPPPPLPRRDDGDG
jgi:membrane peptidoglycan carboxypeptidase